jgi:hypothetical protein
VVACSVDGGDGVLQVKRSRSRVKRSSGVKGEAVESTTCSEGEAIEDTLRRRWHVLLTRRGSTCILDG